MTFEKGQIIYFIYKVKAKKKNRHIWQVKQGIVINDNGTGSKIDIKPVRMANCKVNRKYVFRYINDAEMRCEYFNHWGKYHKNVNYRGRKKKRK